MTGDKVERKYLVHYVDSTFKSNTPSYYRLGKNLEEYNIELNPNVDTLTNIWGETANTFTGFQASSSVDTYYAYEGDPLFTQLCKIINERQTGAAVESYVVDVLISASGEVIWAYKEECLLIPQSMGGGNGGVNVPFQVMYNGNRVKGDWDIKTKTFTEDKQTESQG